MRPVLCDTGVISRMLTGVAEYQVAAQQLLSDEREIFITANIKIELFAWLYGYREQLTKTDYEQLIKNVDLFPVIHADKKISEQAVMVARIRPYIRVSDCLTAATAILKKIELFSINLKDFRGLSGLTLYQPPNFLKGKKKYNLR